jgi:ketosteroid isomerase-like protein
VVKMRLIVLLSSATLLLHAGSAAAADRVKAGQWETKMTMGGRPMVSAYCITAAEAKLMNGDAAAVRRYVEESTEKNTRGRCSVKRVTVSGNRTVVTIVCGKSEVVGTTTYHGDHYESTSSDGTTLTGKRIGACP